MSVSVRASVCVHILKRPTIVHHSSVSLSLTTSRACPPGFQSKERPCCHWPSEAMAVMAALRANVSAPIFSWSSRGDLISGLFSSVSLVGQQIFNEQNFANPEEGIVRKYGETKLNTSTTRSLSSSSANRFSAQHHSEAAPQDTMAQLKLMTSASKLCQRNDLRSRDQRDWPSWHLSKMNTF